MIASRRTVTVSITPEQDALLRACPTSGRYYSVSEVMRAGLRLLESLEAPHLPPIREGDEPTSPPYPEQIGRKA